MWRRMIEGRVNLFLIGGVGNTPLHVVDHCVLAKRRVGCEKRDSTMGCDYKGYDCKRDFHRTILSRNQN